MRKIPASVIICVYNRGTQVLDCLNSLLAMDFRDFEIILVDDASTDDTPERLERFRQSCPEVPVRIVRNEHNLGVSGARNAGLKVAQGEFVFFTDSDCTVDVGWLGTLMKGFNTPDIGAVAGTVIDVLPQTLAERAYVGTCRIGQQKRQQRSLVGNNMGFRREVAVRYLFDEALTYGCDEDDIAWRMHAKGHQIAFVPGAVTHHNHRMNLRGYLGQARRQGRGSARFWYKRGIYVGRDLWALTAALLTLPLAFFNVHLLSISIFFLLLQFAALAYSEMFFKGKSGFETLRVLPFCTLYTICKGWNVLTTLLRIVCGGEQAIRHSKQRWLQHSQIAAR